MPCYDKKLEASRTDFYNDVYSTRDVDCVITTGELETMMREKGFDLSLHLPPEDQPLRIADDDEFDIPELILHRGTSSGSYLHSIIDAIQSQTEQPTILSSKVIRNADYEEFTLRDANTSAVLFKGAKCYGFRNLQNVVRKVGRDAGVQTGRGAAKGAMVSLRKRKTQTQTQASSDESRGYDYVEVMACPSGCVNGGGQLRPSVFVDVEGFTRDAKAESLMVPDIPSGTLTPASSATSTATTPSSDPISAKWGDKAWTTRVEVAYWNVVLDDRTPLTPPSSPKQSHTFSPEADARSSSIIAELLQGVEGESALMHRRETLLRTDFRAVESSEVVGLTVQW